MLRTQLELEPPEVCLLGQALLWLRDPSEPILDHRLHEDVVERDLANLNMDNDPFHEYNSQKEALFIALREGKIVAEGDVGVVPRILGRKLTTNRLGSTNGIGSESIGKIPAFCFPNLAPERPSRNSETIIVTEELSFLLSIFSTFSRNLLSSAG